MSTNNRFTYHIDPRSDSVGGGYQLKLMDNGQEVGGGVFPVTDDMTSDEAYLQASDAAEEWLQSRALNVGGQLDDTMVDIETLGKKPGAAVLTIGAVMFGAGGLGATFYSPVQLQSCIDVGLTIDPDTVAWWMKQSDEARKAAFCADAPALPVVLMRFTDWFVTQQARYPWCHGATFDVPILDAAYAACGMQAPWKFYDVRDTRTLYHLARVKVDRTNGTHHNALDDAKAQAEAAVKALHVLQPHWKEAAEGLQDEVTQLRQVFAAACLGPGRDVLAERSRQIEVEKWTPEHDSEHADYSLAQAAAAYAFGAAVDEAKRAVMDEFGPGGMTAEIRQVWPKSWAIGWFKPRNRRADLVKAGALILAEIERLDRAAQVTE